MHFRLAFYIPLLIVSAWVHAEPATQPAFEWGAGEERIVLVGGGMVEQMRMSGYVEARLMRWGTGRAVVVRNLGWSGDSVTGAARTAGYERPAGRERLLKEAGELKPTVFFVGYGMVESYGGEAGLAGFVKEYEALLDALAAMTPRAVLLSPTFHEDLGGSLEDPAGHNRDLEKYVEAILGIAQRRGLPFVDLFHPLVAFKRERPSVQLTSNGIALNDAGYFVVAGEIERQLGLRGEAPVVRMWGSGQVQVRMPNVPAPAAPEALRGVAGGSDGTRVRIEGLEPGVWALTVDGREAVSADARAWAEGVAMPEDLDARQAEDLRRALVRSGELFYRRSRPFNDHSRHWTYINGDYALYDRQIEELDGTIASLRVPSVHELKVTRKDASRER